MRQEGYDLRYDVRDDLTGCIPASPPGDEIPTAELVPPAPSRPRVYVALLVGTLVIPTAAIVSGIVLVVVGLLYFGPEMQRWFNHRPFDFTWKRPRFATIQTLN